MEVDIIIDEGERQNVHSKLNGDGPIKNHNIEELLEKIKNKLLEYNEQ